MPMLLNSKKTKELMQVLGLDGAIEQLVVKASSILWYDGVAEKDKNNIMRKALGLKINGTMKRLTKERSRKVRLKENDGKTDKNRLEVNIISGRMR